MPELMTVNEAAEMLSVHPSHVRRMARAGDLESRRTTPRKTMITRASIEALINENNNSKQQQAVNAD